MKTTTLALIGLALCAAPFTTVPASAQGGDAAYCGKLTNMYQTYVERTNRRGEAARNGAVDEAISKCHAGDYSGIPVLEKQLTDAKVDLPAR
ncbi:MAG: hypothetical protein JOY81_05355 [Alphaproteobacteria bacterium]|nr:hypothetical protein [Alphaproteobacteria bacterium]